MGLPFQRGFIVIWVLIWRLDIPAWVVSVEEMSSGQDFRVGVAFFRTGFKKGRSMTLVQSARMWWFIQLIARKIVRYS